jgi:uncharacterized protein (DUF2164 family)
MVRASKIGSMMSSIELSKEVKEHIVSKIKLYFHEELDQEIGSFDAEFLLDFFAEEVGSFFYNQGLYDAKAVFEKHLENIDESIYAIEQATDLR